MIAGAVWPDLREEMPLVWSIARAVSNLLSVALDQVAAVGRRFLTPLCRAREPRIAELLRSGGARLERCRRLSPFRAASHALEGRPAKPAWSLSLPE
jgi:hypothetical protein